MMSTDLYRGITDAAHDSPGWLHRLAELGTDAGLLLLAGVAAAAWWRARRGTARGMALALLVPVATVAAYVCSEALKTVVDEERPCRAVTGAAPPIASCPPPGDWSFPSNHATLAAALAVGAVFAWRRTAALALPLAALLAFSRVYVGVHYPHDVAAGAVLGAVTAAACAGLLAGPAAARVARIRTTARHRRPGVAARVVGPGPAAPSTRPVR
ncbi:phosphatase PAP2 family protein [Streptomyces sp. XD-27]|uniref:phosphatase PAP2 family protein n=1 Tax=Streptomyces sp. XD-27 TaxID=3062779 RepID=UPI0026F470EC|nr:phosphatase PAP2 family protein [Streptomyces sp. XD-27]WKX71830.1 phosphatase PAP2 family protein [Streptomyces sp. XD-27]